MGLRGSPCSMCVVALLALVTTALLLLLASTNWPWRSPSQQPEDALSPEEHSHAFGTEQCISRACAQLYDVLLRQCVALRRLKNASTNGATTGHLKMHLEQEDDTCLPGKATKMHCGFEKQLCKTVDVVEKNVLPVTPVSKAESVEWAADDEIDLQEIVERGSERGELGRSSPIAATTHPSSLIGHIFLGALLLLSAGVALCEVFRDRLREKRTPQGVAKFGPAATSDLRRSSVADVSLSRNRRESVHGTVSQQVASGLGAVTDLIQQEQSSSAQAGLRRHRLTAAASFDSGLRSPGGAPPPRASYRILGHRPPPLQRRRSFPVPLTAAILSGGGQAEADQYCSVGSSKLSRRSSVEQSEEEYSPDLRRRVRIIRRH